LIFFVTNQEYIVSSFPLLPVSTFSFAALQGVEISRQSH